MVKTTGNKPATDANAGGWQVYILRCSDDSLYTGITRDIDRRMSEHGGPRGARYFRGRKPRQLVYLEQGHDHGSALRREAEIKQLTRAGKLALIAGAVTATPAS